MCCGGKWQELNVLWWKVVVYEVSEGWSSLVDFFNVPVNITSRSVHVHSLIGDRDIFTTFATTYVAHCPNNSSHIAYKAAF